MLLAAAAAGAASVGVESEYLKLTRVVGIRPNGTKMSSSTIATAFASVLSLGLSRVINTGDRALDNALLTFILALNTMLMVALADEDMYNYFVYKFIDRPKEGGKFRHTLYKFDKLKNLYTKHRSPAETDLICSLTQGTKFILGTMTAIEKNYPHVKKLYDNAVANQIVISHHTNNSVYYMFTIAIYNGEFVYMYKPNHSIYCLYSMTNKNIDAFCDEYGISKTKEETSTSLKLYQGMKAKGLISTRKTFDTIFYDQKEQLLRILEKFKTKTLYPETISMDNKLGILLYGPPGTGKTGTISAIANYLRRDVMVINFAETTKCSELDELLREENTKKYIYVFDEFDCILDVMTEGNVYAEEKPAEKTDWASLLAVAEKEERQKILDMMRESVQKAKKPDRIDLGYLLQKLDGIEDNNDRIIIATTNHPENINPALLRPGRFDLKICLGNCSAQMYEDILANFFKGDAEVRLKISKMGLPIAKWSPLQVINTAIVNETLDATLKALK